MADGIVVAYNGSRAEMTQKDVATLADVGVGNVAILIGTGVSPTRLSETVDTLRMAANKLRELDFPNATTAGNYVSAGGAPGIGSGEISFSLDDGALATPVETEVGVVYQDTFDNVPHSTAHLDVTVDELINKFLEDVAVVT